MQVRATIAVLIFALAPSLAIGQTMNMGESSSSARSPAYKALMGAMQKMDKDMNVKPTGNADMDFVTMMIPHHQGAIDMARVELKIGKDPKIRRLASAIIKAQRREIAEMKSWEAAHRR